MKTNIRAYYRADLDELRLFNTKTQESVVYIQGYSRKYPIPTTPEVSTELLVLMATRYPEVAEAI